MLWGIGLLIGKNHISIYIFIIKITDSFADLSTLHYHATHTYIPMNLLDIKTSS